MSSFVVTFIGTFISFMLGTLYGSTHVQKKQPAQQPPAFTLSDDAPCTMIRVSFSPTKKFAEFKPEEATDVVVDLGCAHRTYPNAKMTVIKE